MPNASRRARDAPVDPPQSAQCHRSAAVLYSPGEAECLGGRGQVPHAADAVQDHGDQAHDDHRQNARRHADPLELCATRQGAAGGARPAGHGERAQREYDFHPRNVKTVVGGWFS